MADEISEKVMTAIAGVKNFERSQITEDRTFAELNIDSLDAINIAFALEEEFRINIPDDELRQIKTVGEAIDGVRRLLPPADGRPGRRLAA
jgi:acyl carrier protein